MGVLKVGDSVPSGKVIVSSLKIIQLPFISARKMFYFFSIGLIAWEPQLETLTTWKSPGHSTIVQQFFRISQFMFETVTSDKHLAITERNEMWTLINAEHKSFIYG